MAQGGKIDLRSLLQIAKRWKWLLILPPILALIGAYAYVATTPPQYTSTTTILFGSNQFITPEMEKVIPGTEVKRFKITDVAENIRKQLLAETTLNKVIERSSMRPSQSMLEAAKEILRSQPDANEQEIIRGLQLAWLYKKVETAVTFPKRGNFVQLSITHTNPEQAYLLTKSLAEVFIEESLLAEEVGPRETLVFATKQLEMYSQKLDQAREALRQFKTGMVRAQTRSVDVNVQNEAQINTQLKSLTVDIADKRNQLLAVENQMGGLKERIAIQLSAKATDLRTQMIEKISSAAVLLMQANWKDPQVIKLNQEIANLRESLQQELRATGAINSANGFSQRDLDLAVQRQMVLTDLDLLDRHQAVLEGMVQTYKQSLTQRPTDDLELAQLQSNVTTYEELVKKFEEQVRSSQIGGALRRSDAEVRYKILDPANRPITPNTADQPKIFLMALLGGLGFGLGLVYLIEFFDHSFKSVDEIEQFLGVTVLGTVPKLDFGEK
jgi:protein tyrosine kinase modulator